MIRHQNISRILLPVILVWASQVLYGCSIPRHIWQEDDVAVSEVNDPGSSKRVLVASGESEFKEAVIARVRAGLEDRGVYINVIGLSELKGQSVDTYGAVVLLNRCVAWGMDPHVDDFLKDRDNGTWKYIMFEHYSIDYTIGGCFISSCV